MTKRTFSLYILLLCACLPMEAAGDFYEGEPLYASRWRDDKRDSYFGLRFGLNIPTVRYQGTDGGTSTVPGPMGGDDNPGWCELVLSTRGQMLCRDDKYGKFARRDQAGRSDFREELLDMVSCLYNSPCIVMWVIFNEGWGQFDSGALAAAVEEIDPTRLIDRASGWHDQGGGLLRSVHLYFDDYKYRPDKAGRCVALSEFGGYSLPVEGHTWPGKPFGYKKFTDQGKYRRALTLLYDGQIRPACMKGLSAAVYTQLTDVENELNGLITYDRRVIKLSPADVKRIVNMPEIK